MTKIQPLQDYLLVEVMEKSSFAVKTSDSSPLGGSDENLQKGKVLAVGPGIYEHGKFITIDQIKPGDVVYWEQHAQANTPEELVDQGKVLLKASRVTAKEVGQDDK